MCLHKFEIHHWIPDRSNTKKWTCRTCNTEFISASCLYSHKQLVHREESFPDGMKSGPKKGTKLRLEHRHGISKSLRIFYGTYNPDIPLGPRPLNKLWREERWCHDYEKWMITVKIRDNFKCQQCFTDNRLEAHHIKPYRFFVEDRYKVDNGLTLCGTCHKKEEAHLKKQRIWAKEFLVQLKELVAQ